jgi:hypothetical protein
MLTLVDLALLAPLALAAVALALRLLAELSFLLDDALAPALEALSFIDDAAAAAEVDEARALFLCDAACLAGDNDAVL